MKKFIVKTSVFLIGAYLLASLLQALVLAAARKINTGEYGVLNAIEKGKINAEILICGSSRGQSHFNPEVISDVTGLSCYNISVNGSRIGVQLPVIKWYLDKNRAPKYLVLNIDVFTVELDPYIYQPYKYLPYLKDNNLYKGLSEIDRNLWLHRSIPFTNLIYFNKEFQRTIFRDFYALLRSKKDSLILGYEPNQRQWVGDIYADNFLRLNAKGVTYTISQRHRDYLNDLIRVCGKHGTQPVFVVSPEYYKSMALLINRKELIDYYVRLCRETGAWWFDFSDSDLCRNKEIWVNFSHLKSVGADMFSRQFATELKKRLFPEGHGLDSAHDGQQGIPPAR